MAQWTERFKLIVTVGLMLIDKDKILLLRRSNTGHNDGYYGLVGGCIDGNETVTQAIIREAYEEANIILKPEWVKMAGVTHSKVEVIKNGDPAVLETVDFFFVSQHYEGNIQNNEPHKHDLLAFFPLDDLPQPLQAHTYLALHHLKTGIPFGEYGWESAQL